MGIQNFPAALQPIIQQNFLAREFEDGLQSVLAYRKCAEREDIAVGIGETVTKTRPGLKAPVETPMTASNNTNLDNGLSASSWTVEQYTVSINMYGDSIDLNTVTSRVGIASQFLQNAKANGVQAAQSLDRLARNALFDAYMGGNTRVKTTLGSPAATIAVDDIRGFQKVMVNGVLTDVSSTNTMSVVVGDNTYTLIGATADGSNTSTAFRGVSGTLTFSGNVTVADGTAGKAVVSSVAPTIIRAGSRATTAALTASDKLTLSMCLDAVAQLRNNGVQPINGLYECHIDATAARQLFADDDFKLAYRGQYNSEEFRKAQVTELLDIRFIPTTEAPQQTLSGVKVRRPIICGQGALIEGDFAGIGATDIAPGDSMIDIIDGIAQVTREPLDRLQQIIAQSWYWIGGFAAPSDYTVNSSIVPTASPAYYKRAVVLECGS
jgi:N4-gp56 family major capsid protein